MKNPRAAFAIKQNTLILILSVMCVSNVFSAPVTLALTGSNATGYLAVTGVNTESVEPNSGLPGSKTFDYPYYFDSDIGLWDILIAEKLSAASVYEQDSLPVLNKTVTDADFASAIVGEIEFDDTLVNASGVSIVSPANLLITLSDSDYSPKPKPRNVNNEFNWTYQITASNIQGTGLTFIDGELTAIDLQADIQVDMWFNGQEAFALTPGFFQASALSINGNEFEFNLNVVETQNSPLGQLDDVQMVFNRAGVIDQVIASEEVVEDVPIPPAFLAALAVLLGWLGQKRIKQRT